MSSAEKITHLLQWCTENGVIIDERLSVQPDPHGGIAVFTRKASIEPCQTVVAIPKSAVLSARSCSFAKFTAPASVGPEAQLALSTALYTEILLGRQSKWYGYLQSLPEGVDLPICWKPWLQGIGRPSNVSLADLEDIREALDWLRGTEAEKIIARAGVPYGVGAEHLIAYFNRVVLSLVSEHMPPDATLEGFMRAYCLVSSRAFIVDAFHGLAMVPIADAFNHIEENHVHLESDYTVCSECGSLDECPHDREGDEHGLATEVMPSTTLRSDYEMVTNAAIPAFSEVYNTYGETLSNAQLLCQYGFVLEANDNDRLTWTVEEILDVAACRSSAFRASIMQACAGYWEGSDFLHEFHETQCLSSHHTQEENSRYVVNSDGQVNIPLWILAVTISAQQEKHKILDTTESQRRLKSLYESHIALESLTGDSDSDDTAEGNGDPSMAALVRSAGDGCLNILRRSYHLLAELCRVRKENTGRHDQGDEEELWDNLEALGNRRRSRFSLLLAMNERLILSSCEATWKDLLLALERCVGTN